MLIRFLSSALGIVASLLLINAPAKSADPICDTAQDCAQKASDFAIRAEAALAAMQKPASFHQVSKDRDFGTQYLNTTGRTMLVVVSAAKTLAQQVINEIDYVGLNLLLPGRGPT